MIENLDMMVKKEKTSKKAEIEAESAKYRELGYTK